MEKQKWSVTIPESTYEVWAESEDEAIDLAIDEIQYSNNAYAENLTEKEKRESLPKPDQSPDYYIKRMAGEGMLRYGVYDATTYVTDGFRVYTTEKEGITDEKMGKKLSRVMEDPNFGTKDKYLVEKYTLDVQDIVKCAKEGERLYSFQTKRYGCLHKVNIRYLLEAIYYAGTNIVTTVDTPNAYIRLNGKYKVTLLPVAR